MYIKYKTELIMLFSISLESHNLVWKFWLKFESYCFKVNEKSFNNIVSICIKQNAFKIIPMIKFRAKFFQLFLIKLLLFKM